MSAMTTTATATKVTLTLDVPVHLLPSRTRGHQHLYLNAPMRWRTYKRLLKALARVGILEAEWVKASVRGRQSLLRPPGTAYGPADPHLVYAVNPTHIDIHTRHAMLRREEREERDGYVTERYNVLVQVTDRTTADYVTSTLIDTNGRRNGLHAPALDIDIPATLLASRSDGRTYLRLTLPDGITITTRQHRRLTKTLTRTGITNQPKQSPNQSSQPVQPHVAA